MRILRRTALFGKQGNFGKNQKGEGSECLGAFIRTAILANIGSEMGKKLESPNRSCSGRAFSGVADNSRFGVSSRGSLCRRFPEK